MAIIKVLKRKDGASLVVGITLAIILGQLLTILPSDLSTRISGLHATYAGNFKSSYLQPIVIFILQIILLELLVRLYIWVKEQISKQRQAAPSDKSEPTDQPQSV